LFRLYFLAFLLLNSLCVYSYPQFSSFGYRSCLTCHYNPQGNGPLNDYGRAVSATAISGRSLSSGSRSEEDLAKSSSFFFGAFDKNTWLRPSVDYRGIQVSSAINQDSGTSRFINMQGVVSITVQNKDRSLYAVADIGYAPAPPRSDESEMRSREHYIGYRLNQNTGIYVGMMDIAYGIRLADHTAFSRRYNSLAQNDQTHGVLVHYSTDKFEVSGHGFLGSMFEESNLRQQGASFVSEYSINPNWHLGASGLYSTSEFKEQINYGLHSRNSFGKGSVILSEVGFRNLKYSSENEGTLGLYGMFRSQTRLLRGLYANSGIDYFRSDLDETPEVWRFSIGTQYFPAQRLEFRVDLSTTRIINSLSSRGASRLREDAFDLFSQVHLWF